MGDKKDIDRLLQQRFKDFEPAPPASVWDAIESKLDQDKKRPALWPLWWKIAGVAAVFAIIISAVVWNFDENIATDQIVIENPEKTVDPDSNNSLENRPSQKEGIVDHDTTGQSPRIKSDLSTIDGDEETIATKAIDNESLKKAVSTSKSQNPIERNQDLNARNTIANNDRSKTDDSNSVAMTSNDHNQSPVHKDDKIPSTSITDKNQTTDNPMFNGIAQNDLPDVDTTTANSQEEKEENLGDIAAAQVDVLKEEDKLPIKKWSASTIVAPVYASSLSGSSINDRVSRNNQDTQTDLSYGVALSYNFDSRWSVRTGVHQVNINYNNQDINYEFNASNVLLNSDQATTIFDPNAVNNTLPSRFENTANSFNQELRNAAIILNFKGELSQQLGYIEVPLEVKYRVIDKKFGLSVLGGFSALFLTDNNVSVSNELRRLDLGEDNNFNDFNQSANFGLGLDYQFTKNIGFSVEPTFKYQLSTLREDFADFRPYTIGVYTGLMYRF